MVGLEFGGGGGGVSECPPPSSKKLPEYTSFFLIFYGMLCVMHEVETRNLLLKYLVPHMWHALPNQLLGITNR